MTTNPFPPEGPAPGMTEEPSFSYRIYVLFILIVVYTFNFIDRLIVGILMPQIKADLQLTDVQLGLMGGTAFALFYTFLGIPIARLADRTNRTWIMTIALTVWSGFTALGGLAQNFWQLFGARLGVGMGEAGGVAPAYSLVADYFPPHQRSRALAAYSFGIPIGSALGIFIGGLIASLIDWRAAFVIVGLAGVALAPIFKLTVKEPVRGRYDKPIAEADAKPKFGKVLATIARKPSFWGLSFGAAFSSIMGYGLIAWLPSFFNRSFGMATMDIAIYYGALTLVGGVIGTWFGGSLADRFGTRNKSAYAFIPAIALIFCVPFYVAGMLIDNIVLVFAVLLVPTALKLMWLGPVINAIQNLVPSNMRATASAIFLFINNLIGIGAGSLIIGFMSDALRAEYGADSLRYAILLGTVFYVVSSTIFVITALRIKKDWQD